MSLQNEQISGKINLESRNAVSGKCSRIGTLGIDTCCPPTTCSVASLQHLEAYFSRYFGQPGVSGTYTQRVWIVAGFWSHANTMAQSIILRFCYNFLLKY